MLRNNFIEQKITETLEANYMPYAMSVIVSRAIPEIDGFKPSHRKLLFTMYKMGLLNGARTKSTNVVGQTMKLNPHGDNSIYETLVRLTRGNGALLHPFIDSKGNFGKQYSREMAYAASRYTEVKLDNICNEIFKNIDKNTVDFIDNYDGTTKEPILFPTTFPNVLVTPNQGIAVSMASSICSFNLKEICNVTIKYIKNPDINLIEHLKAPDFPTGGEIIYNKNELQQVYDTGKGSFKIRGKYKFDSKNSLIEIYEIPYTTTIEAIIDKIITLVKSGKIKEINDVRNETDKSGLKITIDIKKNTNVEFLMSKLYSMTPLCDTFSANFNILIKGSPKIVGIKAILNEWVDFRIGCIKRQTEYDLEKKKAKYHLLCGLSKIIMDIDKAIKIIRETEEDSLVIINLKNGFNIDEVQAEFIAEIKLRNLNKEYLLKKINEQEELKDDMKHLEEIRDNEHLIKNIITKELKDIAKKYGTDRHTEIISPDDIVQISEEEMIEDYEVRLFLTKDSYFKKITQASFRASSEHKLKDGDEIIQEISTNNKSDIMFFSNKHNVYKAKLHELVECKASSIGNYLSNILGLEEEEKIIYMVSTVDYKGYMLFIFENGKFAKIDLGSYATKVNRKKLINAYSNKNNLVGISFTECDKDFIVIRDNDKALLFNSMLIESKATKNSAGIQAFTMKNNSFITKILNRDEFLSDDIEYYRSKKVPSSGHFITEIDKIKNKI